MTVFIVISYRETLNTDDFLNKLIKLKKRSLVEYYGTSQLIDLLFNKDGSKKYV